MEPLPMLTPDAAPATARLEIEGMTCGGCAAKVRRTLSAVPGVIAAEVTLAEKLATVGYDPSRVSVEAIAQAVVALAYEVRTV